MPIVPIFLFMMIPITLIGVPIARAIARRIDRGSTRMALSPDVSARLDRMEQAIDAIALEVERIAEGQRFTTKLLAERGSGGPDRVIAPERQGAEHG
jgi:hypothetical protein